MQRMKNRKFHFLIIFLICPIFAKDIYFTRSGIISFFSSAPLENIEAVNEQVTCVLDMETGEVAFRVPVPSFTFKNGLMQEHFNENYLESEKYPHASFKGSIDDWDLIMLSNESQQVKLTGIMNIHGVSHEVKYTGMISKIDEQIRGSAKFKIIVADYEIKIPKIVRDNIAKVVDVTVNLNLKKK
jgi:polyisoprenoid-binding protein YceI